MSGDFVYGLASVEGHASCSLCVYLPQRNLFHLCALLPVGYLLAKNRTPQVCIVLSSLVFRKFSPKYILKKTTTLSEQSKI